MNERKLASVRRIANIEPIPGADKILKITVDGWQLVSNVENNFKIDQLVIYFEIDSFLPVIPQFEWMRDRCYKNTTNLGEGFLVRTIKLRGQVSQGLIVPIEDFASYFDLNDEHQQGLIVHHSSGHERDGSYDWDEFVPISEGMDLTDMIGVKKFEKPIPAELAGKVRGSFPSFISKTDQDRVQNCFGTIKKWISVAGYDVNQIIDSFIFSTLESNPKQYNTENITYFKSGDMWFAKQAIRHSQQKLDERSRFEATIKLDGSSMTVYYRDGQIGVCSRNNDLTRSESNSFWNVALESRIFHPLIDLGRNLALQGELMGPGIEGNREDFTQPKFYVYDIYDIDTSGYLAPSDRRILFEWLRAHKSVEHSLIRHVPLIDHQIDISSMTVAELLELADKQRSINHQIAEGIVFKSCVLGGPSFKVISNKFLLKETD